MHLIIEMERVRMCIAVTLKHRVVLDAAADKCKLKTELYNWTSSEAERALHATLRRNTFKASRCCKTVDMRAEERHKWHKGFSSKCLYSPWPAYFVADRAPFFFTIEKEKKTPFEPLNKALLCLMFRDPLQSNYLFKANKTYASAQTNNSVGNRGVT